MIGNVRHLRHLKELVDNAVDAYEGEIAPEIKVRVNTDTRSSRETYVSPSRGQR